MEKIGELTEIFCQHLLFAENVCPLGAFVPHRWPVTWEAFPCDDAIIITLHVSCRICNSSCYYHHQIGSIHLSHCFHIFPWLCVWDVCYIIFCHLYTFRENREFVFISIVHFTTSANSRIRLGLQIVFVCLYITPSHSHHCANFIWRNWTYKLLFRYNLSSVWVRLSIFSQLSIIQYVGLCFQFTHFLCDDWENVYILCLIIIIKSEVWTITLKCQIEGRARI